MTELLNISIIRSYAEIYQMLNICNQLLPDALLNEEKKKELITKLIEKNQLIKNTEKELNEYGDDDEIFNLIKPETEKIGKILYVLDTAETLSNSKSLKDIKANALELGKRFEETKKIVYDINDGITNIIYNSLIDEKSKKEFESSKKAMNNAANEIKKMKFDSKIINETILVEQDEITDAYNDIKEILGKEYFGNIVNIINMFSLKDDKENYVDGLGATIDDSDKTEEKRKKLNEYIAKLKENESFPFKKLINPNPDLKKYLEKNGIKLDYNNEELSKIIYKLYDIKFAENEKSIENIFKLVSELVKDKKIMIFEQLYNSWKELPKKFPNLNLAQLSVINAETITKYELFDIYKLKGFKENAMKQEYETLRNAVVQCIKIDVDMNEKYEESKKALKDALEDYKKFSENYFKKDAKSEEKEEALKKLGNSLDNFKKFNEKFFKEINEYLKDKKKGITNSQKNNCVLSNEINKVVYYSKLFELLNKNKAKETESDKIYDYNKKNYASIKDKMKLIEKLESNFSKFLENQTKENYFAYKLDNIKENDPKNFEKNIGEIASKVNVFIDNMQKIGKELEKIRIEF